MPETTIVETPLGKFHATLHDNTSVSFITSPEFGGYGNKEENAITVRGVRYHVALTLRIDGEGNVVVAKSYNTYDKGIALAAPNVHEAIDARNTKSRRIRWRPRHASEPAARKIAEAILPKLVEFVRNSRIERARVGLKVLLGQAKYSRDQAEEHRKRAIQCDVDAAHAEALADQLRATTVWVGDAVEEARAPEGV